MPLRIIRNIRIFKLLITDLNLKLCIIVFHILCNILLYEKHIVKLLYNMIKKIIFVNDLEFPLEIAVEMRNCLRIYLPILFAFHYSF